jgi:hypothetical protein
LYRWQQAGHAEDGNRTNPGSQQQRRQSTAAIGVPQHSRGPELGISRSEKRTGRATMAKQQVIGQIA